MTIRRSRQSRLGFRLLTLLCTTTALLAVPVATGLLPSASATVYRSWALSGVTFTDGGTISGNVVIADDGSIRYMDVTMAGGDVATFGTVHYVGEPTPLVGGYYVWAPGFGQYFWMNLPDTSGTGPGDTRPFSHDSWECMNCSPIRYVNAGTLIAGDTVDFSAPDITAVVDPASPDGDNGWYVGSPTVSFTVTDPDSAVSGKTGCDPTTVDTDTVEVVLQCEATSGGGTATASATVHRDATPPSLAPQVATPVVLNGTLDVAPHASDATSGLADAQCTGLTSVPGVASATCEASDLAGNDASVQVPYVVEYVMSKISVSRGRRVGHDLRIAVHLEDAAGVRPSTTEAKALGCRLKLRIFGTQIKHACLSYDRKTRTFSTMRPLMRKGDATMRVWLTYPGTSRWTRQLRTITIKG